MNAKIESPDEFIVRAADFAYNRHKGQLRPYLNDEYFNHLAEVAILVSRVTDNPIAIAIAYLHDTIEDNKATLDEIAQEFGFVVAAGVDALTDRMTPADGNRAFRKKAYADRFNDHKVPHVHTVKVADLIVNTTSIVAFDYAFARTYIPEKRYLLEQLKLADGRLIEEAERQLKKAEDYLENVVGNVKEGAPKLSNGFPATLGAYRMLASISFGPESPATKFLNEEIELAPNGPGQLVSVSEADMVGQLKKAHDQWVENRLKDLKNG
jgi:hypothetical protein